MKNYPWLLCLFLLFLPSIAFCQPQKIDDLEQNLLQVLDLEQSIKTELEQTQKELRSPKGTGRQVELEAEVRALSKRLEELRTNFTEIALGVDLSKLKRLKKEQTFSWSDELRDLLSPLIAELRDVTSRPREISKLKEELAIFQQQKETAELAERNLEALHKQVSNKKLKEPVDTLLKEWDGKLKSLNAELAITKEKLEQKQAERKTVGQTLEGFFSLFFESRGRNLFLAFLVSVLVWFSLRYLPKFIVSKIDAEGKRLSHAGKIVQVAGLVTSTLGAILAFLGMLYLYEDWVLLLIFSLLFLGLLWTMKDTLPQLWQQLAILLNIGPVREGERVEINGVAWIVHSIGFYCFFRNDTFSTGRSLRLPIQDLLTLRSRKMKPGEKLFPTKVGDYVTFHGDKYGQVSFQSPEYVEISGFGDSRYFISTSQFLAAEPRVLTYGFGERITFGVDYQHQTIATTEVPEKLRNRIQEEFRRVNLTDQVRSLSVEFKEAGASSLDLSVSVEFKGEAAGRYLSLPRIIQRACVEACNENGWIIPFTQMTVHMATDSNEPSKAA